MTVDLSEGWARGQGHDTFDGVTSVIGGHGDDLLVGTSGNDYLDGRQGSDRLFGGTGKDVLSDSEAYEEDTWDDLLVGGSGNDRVNVAYSAGNDDVRTGKGDDHILGGEGRDHINGGPGSDMLSYWAYFELCDNSLGGDRDGLTIDLRTGEVQEGDIDITFERINRAAGTVCDDVLIGAAGKNALVGHEGDDALYGMAGDDMLSGNLGADNLHGGKGFDSCAPEPDDTHEDCEE
jgi:Ca2+-binding RTX toxin-like protein